MSLEERLTKLEADMKTVKIRIGIIPDTNYKKMEEIEKVGPNYYRTQSGGSQKCKFCPAQIVWKQGERIPYNVDGTPHVCPGLKK